MATCLNLLAIALQSILFASYIYIIANITAAYKTVQIILRYSKDEVDCVVTLF